MSPIHQPPKKNRRAEKRLRQTTFRLRVFVWRPAEDEPMPGYGFLSELTPSGAGIFLESEIEPASTVRLAFESESGPTYRAVVIWANRVSLGQRFFGKHAPSYRLGLRFQFVSEAERQRYIRYLEELKARALTIEPGMKF